MPRSLVVDWASVHNEMSNILSVLVISARSLILLTGGSFLVLHPLYPVHSTQPGRAFLIASPMMLLLFPKLPSGSHLRVGVKVHMVIHKHPTLRSLVSTPPARPILLWPLCPTWCSSHLSRMLSLEASPPHVSTSNLISLKLAHRSPIPI